METRRGSRTSLNQNEREYKSHSNERHVRLNEREREREREQRSGKQQTHNRSQSMPERNCQRGTDSLCQQIPPDRREHDILGLQRSQVPEDEEEVEIQNSICPNPYKDEKYSGYMTDRDIDETIAHCRATRDRQGYQKTTNDRQGYQKTTNDSRDCAMMGRSMRLNNTVPSQRLRTQNSNCCDDLDDDEFAPQMESTRMEYSRSYDQCETKPRTQELTLPKCRITNNAALRKPNQIDTTRTCAIYPKPRRFSQESLMDSNNCRGCDDYKQPYTTGRQNTSKKTCYCPIPKSRQMKSKPLRRSPDSRSPTYAQQMCTSDSMENITQANNHFACSENSPKQAPIDYRSMPYYVEETEWEDTTPRSNNSFTQDECKVTCNERPQNRSRSLPQTKAPNMHIQRPQAYQLQQSQMGCTQASQYEAQGPRTRSQFYNLDISEIEPLQRERRNACDEWTNTPQVLANRQDAPPCSIHSLCTQTMATPLMAAACQTSRNILQTQMNRSIMRPNRTQSTAEENFIKRGKEAQFKKLVLDNTCPGAIQESLNGTANLNEQAQDILYAGVLPQKSPKPDPITIIEALQMRIEYERSECLKKNAAAAARNDDAKTLRTEDINDYFSTKQQTDLNVALAAFLRVESVARSRNMKQNDDFTANVNKINTVYPGAPVAITHVTGDTNPVEKK